METTTAVLIILGIAVVGFLWYRSKKSNGTSPPPDNNIPTIPDHDPEQTGDVNNGAWLSSIGRFDNNFTSVVIQFKDDGKVYETVVPSAIDRTERVIGEWVYEGFGEGFDASDYTFTAAAKGPVPGSKSGNMSDMPSWKIDSSQLTRGDYNSFVYVSIESPSGNLDGVIVVHMSIVGNPAG